MAIIVRPTLGVFSDLSWIGQDNDSGADLPWITYLDGDSPLSGNSDADWSVTDDDDGDPWIIVEAQSAPVTGVAAAPPAQYYGEDAELADEAIDPIAFGNGYQQADLDVLPIEDAWEWWLTEEDDYTVVDDYALVDLVLATQPEDAWDHFSSDDDEYFPSDNYVADGLATYYGEDAEQLAQEDDDYAVSDNYAPEGLAAYYGEDAELAPQEDDEQVDVAEFALIENLSPVEDAWDHFAQEDDEYAVSENYSPDGVTQYYGDDAEQLAQEDDEQVVVLEFASVDSNPVICVEDAADHWPTEDDDYVVLDDYALIENLAPIEDAWDHFAQDDDEQADVNEFALVSVPLTSLQYYGEDAETADADQDDDEWLARTADVLGETLAQVFDDGADVWTQDEDDYSIVDDYALVENLSPVEDAWDHFAQDDDEQVVVLEHVLVDSNPVICVEDAADHWSTEDDELSPIDEVQSSTASAPIEDAWDHWAPDIEEQLPLEEAQPAAPVALLPCPDDAWDHWPTTDDSDYYVADDYELRTFSTLTLSGVSFSGSFALGTLVLPVPKGPYQYDPRFYNGSNAWLGYRSASGGGIW